MNRWLVLALCLAAGAIGALHVGGVTHPVQAENTAIKRKQWELTDATRYETPAAQVIAAGATYTSPEIQLTPGVNPSALAYSVSQASGTVAVSVTAVWGVVSGKLSAWTDQTSGSYTETVNIYGATPQVGGTPWKQKNAGFVQFKFKNNDSGNCTLANSQFGSY